MASVTLHNDRLPIGATASAYPRSNFPAVPYMPTGAPVGLATDTATVADDGSTTFDGLDYGTAYVAHAKVGTEERYVLFMTPAQPDEVTSTDVSSIVKLSQTEYDALDPADPDTLYVIVD